MSAAAVPARYDATMKWLHWIIALLVIANLIIGLTMGGIPRQDPMKMVAIVTHMSIGMSVLILSIVMVVWRIGHPGPALPDTMNPLLKMLAGVTLFLLYALILLIPFFGWAMVSAHGNGGPPFFGLFNWPALPFFAGMTKDSQHAAHEFFENGHVLLAYLAIALVVLHICGALYHQFVAKDRVLKSMLPGG